MCDLCGAGLVMQLWSRNVFVAIAGRFQRLMEANEADLAAAGAAAPGRPGSGGDSGNGNASQPARKSARSRAPSGRVRAASEEALDEGGGEAQPSSRSMRGASGCGSGDRAGSSGSSGDLGSEDLATDDAAGALPSLPDHPSLTTSDRYGGPKDTGISFDVGHHRSWGPDASVACRGTAA